LGTSVISLSNIALVLFALESLVGERKVSHIAHLVPSYGWATALLPAPLAAWQAAHTKDAACPLEQWI